MWAANLTTWAESAWAGLVLQLGAGGARGWSMCPDMFVKMSARQRWESTRRRWQLPCSRSLGTRHLSPAENLSIQALLLLLLLISLPVSLWPSLRLLSLLACQFLCTFLWQVHSLSTMTFSAAADLKHIFDTFWLRVVFFSFRGLYKKQFLGYEGTTGAESLNHP